MTPLPPRSAPLLACVILAHADPTHLHRLARALAPFPVFVHVDSRTPESVYRAMVDGLPNNCVVLDRIATGWARWENVEAELAGYRAALETTAATHVALFTGSDYPLAGPEEIESALRPLEGKSIATIHPLPHPYWGQNGGFSRLRYRHWVFRKHMIRLPLPRRLPRDVMFAGGSQLKVLSREHAAAVLDVARKRPDLVRFWRRSWIADETFVPSLLSTPDLVAGWADSSVDTSMWFIRWASKQTKSPPWLTLEHRDEVLSRRKEDDQAADFLFARKFSTELSTPLLDAIDAAVAERRSGHPEPSAAES